MTNVSNVLAPVEALPDEVDGQKRHWLQAFHPPVEQVTAPQVQEPVSPESIVADFIRQHSASGQLVGAAYFCSHLIRSLKPIYPRCWMRCVRTQLTRISPVCRARKMSISTQRKP